jgi:hypothetical protein
MKNKQQLALIIFIGGICLFGGFMLGMIMQQMILTASFVEIAEGLEGTNINVEIDLNETKLAEDMKDFATFILNSSIIREEKRD